MAEASVEDIRISIWGEIRPFEGNSRRHLLFVQPRDLGTTIADFESVVQMLKGIERGIALVSVERGEES